MTHLLPPRLLKALAGSVALAAIGLAGCEQKTEAPAPGAPSPVATAPATTPDAEYRSRIAGLTHEELLTDSRRIRVPTLVVRGAMSDVLSDEGVRELLETIPGAEAAIVDRAGHQVAGDRNDAFLVAIEPFLARRYPATPAEGSPTAPVG